MKHLDATSGQLDPRVEAHLQTQTRDLFGMLPLYATLETDAAQTCELCDVPVGEHGFAYPIGGGWSFLCGLCARDFIRAAKAVRVMAREANK